MNRIATARNATYIGIAGALLWLVRMPSFQLESLASPINAPGIDVVVRTFSGVALIGITAIATATGLNALMSRRRPASLVSLAMIAGLVTYAIWLRSLNDAVASGVPGVDALAMGLFGVGWLFLAASDRSLTALLAACAMLVHALGLVAGGPLADAFFLLDLAAAVFGVSALMYYASRGASVTTLSDESPISPGPKRPLPQR